VVGWILISQEHLPCAKSKWHMVSDPLIRGSIVPVAEPDKKLWGGRNSLQK
jgi:hypothetical protein